MGDKDRGRIVVRQRRLQDAVQARPAGVIDRGEGLIQQQQAWVDRERPRQRHALTLPPRERVGTRACEVREAKLLEQRLHARIVAAALRAGQPEGHVRRHVAKGQQRVLLGHIADAAAVRRHVYAALAIQQHVAVHSNPAALRRHQTRERLHGQGLARAGGAEEHQNSALERELGLDHEALLSLPHPDRELRLERAPAHRGSSAGARREASRTTLSEIKVSTTT